MNGVTCSTIDFGHRFCHMHSLLSFPLYEYSTNKFLRFSALHGQFEFNGVFRASETFDSKYQSVSPKISYPLLPMHYSAYSWPGLFHVVIGVVPPIDFFHIRQRWWRMSDDDTAAVLFVVRRWIELEFVIGQYQRSHSVRSDSHYVLEAYHLLYEEENGVFQCLTLTSCSFRMVENIAAVVMCMVVVVVAVGVDVVVEDWVRTQSMLRCYCSHLAVGEYDRCIR